MRPSFPTPQGLQPVRHPSKFTRVQSVFKEQSRLDFLSKLMDSWLVFRRDRVILNQWTKRNDWSCKTFRMVSSHQIINLWRFADSSSIPWNPSTIFRPDLIVIVPQMSLFLTLRTALLTIPYVFDLCGVDVRWFQDNSSQDLPTSKELLVQMTFWFPRRLQELLQALLRFLRSFCFLHGYDCIHCVMSCTTTAYRWLFRDSTFFTENFVIRSFKITKNFRSVHGCASARSLCNFRFHADIAILVFREVCTHIVLTWYHLLAAMKVIHEKNRKRLGVLEHFHLPDRAWTPFNHATCFHVLLRCRHFCLVFRCLLVHATGFPVLRHSYSHFLLMLDAPW